jgi:type VI secretion system protein ImpE
MIAEQMLREGKLLDALEDLQIQIRKAPDNSRYRIFYFQLLALLGQWERALNQLNVIEQLDKDTWPMAQTYRAAIQCEVLRTKIFAGQQSPLIFGEPPSWMALLVEALRLMAEKQYAQAATLRDEAFAAADASKGSIDEQPFEWIADADSRLGPVLEIIVNGRYYWAPFQQIRSIRINPPQDLRDLVSLPAQFIWTNDGEAVGLIPARYPGSETAGDATVQMARTTQWQEAAEGITLGLGQRMLATDREDYPLLEIRTVTMK